MARVQLRLLHERCSPARDSFPPAFPFLSNFEISYPIPSYTLEFSNIFTFRSPSRFSPDASERTESVKHFTFSIGEFFSNAMRRYAKRKNDNFPTHPSSSLSLFLFGQANNREGATYTQSRGYTARHLRNHVSVPLLRSHASSRASIEERFHGAMLAIRFHRLVSRSFDPPRIYFKSATRERIPHLIIDGQFHTDTDMRMGE